MNIKSKCGHTFKGGLGGGDILFTCPVCGYEEPKPPPQPKPTSKQVEIEGKWYLPVELLEEQGRRVYLGGHRGMRRFCQCGGWGCVFCCRDHTEWRQKGGVFS